MPIKNPKSKIEIEPRCGGCFHRVGPKELGKTPCLRMPGEFRVEPGRKACGAFLAIDAGKQLYKPLPTAQSTERPESETNNFIFAGEED